MSSCWCILAILVATARHKVVVAADDTSYNAVVVEYSPVSDPTVDPGVNILNNVISYVQIINEASSSYSVDIIIFPESGLVGFGNQEIYLEIPDPIDHLVLCDKGTKFDAPLVQLSCAARATSTYVVVNLSEKNFDYNLQKMFYYNTDVVFDRNGAIIARYRKTHLFGEGDKHPPTEKEDVYFDTDFGVRFGIFTCFDIIFKDPGIESAEKYNITHFIFPTAWFSEMPFLTAIQEQWYWSYTQNAVLLAAGYNLPVVGSSGTGIYMGQKGPAIYDMMEARGSFFLHAQVPKNIHSKGYPGISTSKKELKTRLSNHVPKENEYLQSNTSQIKLKRDFLDVYVTKQISIPEDTPTQFNGTDITMTSDVQEVICHQNLCCEFTLRITIVYSLNEKNVSRGDDYSQMYYRMAAFDGVRTYDHVATGGLQTCAIIPCVSNDLASCGLRADNPLAVPNSRLGYHQTSFIFESIHIKGTFCNIDSFIGPNALLGGERNNFGSLLRPESFYFSTSNETKATAVNSFQTLHPIDKLVTASLYGRVFGRDGETYTGSPSSGCNAVAFPLFVLIIIKFCIT